MNPAVVSVAVQACLLVAVLIGNRIGRRISAFHASAETRDTVKLATGLVATMAALLLGLLVSSAKSSHDARRGQVIQMASKIIFLDRVLAGYGPESRSARAKVRLAVEELVDQIWLVEGKRGIQASFDRQAGDEAFLAIESLAPNDDRQRGLKEKASGLAIEIGQLRALLLAQSIPSISMTMLVVVACWLVVIFLSFSIIAPPNPLAHATLLISALSVSGAIFLILELDQPFDGAIQTPKEPIAIALSHLGK